MARAGIANSVAADVRSTQLQKEAGMNPMKSLRWIESKSVEKLTRVGQSFSLSPGGEGRGEGERKF
jgi:hypothetical protein